MQLSKSKIVRNVLSVLTILLIVSCKTAPEWSWEADFYAADHLQQDLYNKDGKIVKCNQPEFDNFACLTYDNIVELEANIEKFRSEYKGLVGFVKSGIKSAINQRAGQDVTDLEVMLHAIESTDKLSENLQKPVPSGDN